MTGVTSATESPANPATTGWCAFPGDDQVARTDRGYVHDPTVLFVGGRYFCFSTSHEGFQVLRSSSDLTNWTQHEPLLRGHPPWLAQRITEHQSIWAPDVVQIAPGRLRMYYCASLRFGWNTSYIGVAECELFDPQSPHRGWRDLGMVIASERGRDHFNAIDPEVIVDNDGRHWMFFGSYFSGLYVTELDPGTGLLAATGEPDLRLVARNTIDRENAIEGAAVIYRDGFYYLFASYGLAAQGVRSNYRIVVGRSQYVTGPFVDRANQPMTYGGHTMVLGSSPPMFGPGHCDVFCDANGRTMMSYHFYDGRKFWRGDKWGLPTLQIREILWSDDGWPLPGLPVHHESVEPKAKLGAPQRWLEQVDFGEPVVIGLDDVRARRVEFANGGMYYAGRDDSGKVIRGVRLDT